MDIKYAIQVVFNEPGRNNQVGFLCYSQLKECYYLAYNLLNCGYCFQLKETAYKEIKNEKEFIIDNIEGINDRKIVSLGVIKIEARIVEYHEVKLL